MTTVPLTVVVPARRRSRISDQVSSSTNTVATAWAGPPASAVSRKGTPSHSETGYLRPRDGGVEGVIGEPIGIAETYAGALDGRRLELTSTAIIRTPTAKEILGVHRVFELGDDGALAVLVDMAAVGHPMGFHLAARLERVEAR